MLSEKGKLWAKRCAYSNFIGMIQSEIINQTWTNSFIGLPDDVREATLNEMKNMRDYFITVEDVIRHKFEVKFGKNWQLED
jgi:hypothetical protein